MEVQDFINQQLGTLKRTHYDNILRRFYCAQYDQFNYIYPEERDTVCESPIFACKFANKPGFEHILGLANEEGRVVIYDTTKKHERFGMNVHFNAIFDITWVPGALKLVTASGDNNIIHLNITESEIKIERLFTGHTRSVKTVVFRKDDPNVFCSGGRDGSILLWDFRTGCDAYVTSNPDSRILNTHVTQRTVTTPSSRKKSNNGNSGAISGSNSVTSLVFRDENTLISCGAGDGIIKAWDLRKTYSFKHSAPTPKYTIPYSGNTTRVGFSNLLVDPHNTKLYANCFDNVIYCYNLATFDPEPVFKYTGHQNGTFYVKSSLSADGAYLISGSSDEHAYIWNTKHPEPVVCLKGHTAEVTCVAWSSQPTETIVTCSDDMMHRVWHVGSDIRPDNWEVEYGGYAELMNGGKVQGAATAAAVAARKRRVYASVGVEGEIKRSRLDDCENSGKRKRDEDIDGGRKRFAGPRRLFSILENNENLEEKVDEEEKTSNLEAPLETNTTTDPFKSPPRQPKRKHPDPQPFSPTTNLPNFVLDGCAPHLNCSPQKRRDSDWLTRLRTEKRLVAEMRALCNPPNSNNSNRDLSSDEARNDDKRSAATASTTLSTTPRTPKLDGVTKQQQRRRRGSNCGSPSSPLYRYFRVKLTGPMSPKLASQSRNVDT